MGGGRVILTLDYEDDAYRVGGLPDNQTLAFDTLEALIDTANALLDVALLKYRAALEEDL